MKIKRLLFFGLLILSRLVNAQTDFRPGYIVKNSGDTLNGKIDYRGDILMGNICKFKNPDNTIKEYSPNDIIAFRFIDDKCYVSKTIDNDKKFLEYLIKGKVNIYYLRDQNGEHYYLDKENLRLSEIPYEEGIKYVDGNAVSYKSKTHIGILSYYMQDAPGIQARIQSIEKPDHKNLIELSEEYHNAVCEGEKCIIYVKKKPIIKANLEAVSGVVKPVNYADIKNKYYFQSGVMAHFCMPRTNEKLYLKIGILYSQIEDTASKKQPYGTFLTHFGYLAPNTFRIRPSFSIGLLSPSYSAGIMIKINKRINLGIQSWLFFDYDSIPWIPEELYNYSILGNIYLEM